MAFRPGFPKTGSYPTTASRRRHDRLDLTGGRPLDAWLVREDGYSACRLLNLSYAGMCLQGEELFEVGDRCRFILDLTALLGTEVEVTVRIVWKHPMDAGLCYAGAVFLKSSAPWLGPEEDDDPGLPEGL